ncbi:hypothetical protein [uncultured Psychroserpens sp.]|uniref:hypothetical protein n=1 Tax=uncultured Psychroserpens sp. TaxID=255436 RepID=UPI0026050A51|nr:hypothetical protein [uncultured Psychroserpens sp.]
MKKIFLTLMMFSLFVSFSDAQIRNRRQQRQAPRVVNEEKEKEKYEAKVEEKKVAYINDLIATLNVDDFQKEIIYQTMYSYFDELTKINKLGLKKFERETEIERLDKIHFRDVKAMVSEEVMGKIMDALKGKWDQKEEKKKKKKKKRKKDKDNN